MVKLFKSGNYTIKELIPQTVNSSDNALYIISVGNEIIDSVSTDQNEGSGSWKNISQNYFPANVSVNVTVKNAGGFSKGDVIRADAIRFQLLDEVLAIEENNSSLPNEIVLHQNYPNPFNPTTKISFTVPDKNGPEYVKLKIFNVLGKEIKTILNEKLSPGSHIIEFNAVGLASGIYFYSLETGGKIFTKKMVLLR